MFRDEVFDTLNLFILHNIPHNEFKISVSIKWLWMNFSIKNAESNTILTTFFLDLFRLPLSVYFTVDLLWPKLIILIQYTQEA